MLEDVLDASSLEMFKVRLHGAVNNLIYMQVSLFRRVGLSWTFKMSL